MEYTSGTEAPRRMHFWTGVSTIAACLRRKVWVDMKRFKWYPSFYIIFVAKPGIVSKTTTMDLGIDLLKLVPGIKFGPDTVTWQALATKFAEAEESFQLGEDWLPMSPLTLASGELGNLINPQDRDMVNFYITMWDGRSSFEKVTKGSGSDSISAPWINLIGCTTPHWIADNMPQAVVGGGFTSRCVFIFADRKMEFITWPDEHVQSNHDELAAKLVADLEYISRELAGPISISPEAREWGREWYKKLWTQGIDSIKDERLEGYLARKQTHMVKLAMVLSVSRSDSLVITLEDLILADGMLAETEKDLDKVFSKIGRTEESLDSERFLEFVKRCGKISYAKAFRHIHTAFPDFRDFTGMLEGHLRSGTIKLSYDGPDPTKDAVLIYTGD